MSENEHIEEVEEFIDYLITELDQKQLAVLYYQALHSTASMINSAEDVDEESNDIDYYDLHNANVDFMASVITDNHTKETRQ